MACEWYNIKMGLGGRKKSGTCTYVQQLSGLGKGCYAPLASNQRVSQFGRRRSKRSAIRFLILSYSPVALGKG